MLILDQLVLFLQLCVVHFQTELLVLIGDSESFPVLFDLHSRLETPMPTIVLSISHSKKINGKTFCPDCPTQRLSIIILSDASSDINLVKNMSQPKDTNRVVVVRTSKSTDLELIGHFHLFMIYNMVLVEVDETGSIQVLAWGTSIRLKVDTNRVRKMVSQFAGPDAIFHNNSDNNALVFRKLMRHWPSSDSASCMFYTKLMSPYHFHVVDKLAQRQLYVASATATLLQLIGNILNFSVNIKFMGSVYCAKCFQAPIDAIHRGRIELFDRHRVLYNS